MIDFQSCQTVSFICEQRRGWEGNKLLLKITKGGHRKSLRLQANDIEQHRTKMCNRSALNCLVSITIYQSDVRKSGTGLPPNHDFLLIIHQQYIKLNSPG